MFVETVLEMCVLKLRLKYVCVETAPGICVLKLHLKYVCVETVPKNVHVAKGRPGNS